MANYKRKGRRKRQEATIVGDLFRILLAVSMLVVAILVAFFVMKNVTGFSLPDLKQTLATETETEAPVTIRVEETKATTAAPTTAEVTTAAESTTESTQAETESESSTESTKESREVLQESKDPHEAVNESRKETVVHAPEADPRYESPVIQNGDSAQSLGPGYEIEIDSHGPVAPN